jgi:hypothetical protein
MNHHDQKPARDHRPGPQHPRRSRLAPTGVAAVALLLVPACGGRSAVWDAPVGQAQPFALADAIAIVDPDANRVVLLTTDVARRARVEAVPIQRGMRAATASPDRSRLFVVSAGDAGETPPGGAAAQGPALEVVTTSAAGRHAYPLSEPLDGIALDPRGEWAVLFASKSSGGLVSNPNELLLVELGKPAATAVAGAAANPVAHTLRSFGGKPQRFTFTDPLELPGGPRRLLIVETEQDVAIVDLLHPADPEITIQLTSGQDARRVHPAAVAVTDGDAGPNDARIAIRTDDRNVMIATLLPAADRDFSPSLNLTDVGAVPSDTAWVRTDAGALGLAALVPGAGKAVVIDPTTGLTVDVALPAAYQRLSLVTAAATKITTTPGTTAGQVAGAAGPQPVDIALLWNANGGGVAFWELGRVAGQPYRSVETVGVTSAVTSVVDVGSAHPELKILQTRDTAFFVLDLKARTSAPFQTSSSSLVISPSASGTRAWAYVPGSSQIASIDLQTLHATERRTERPLSSLFEIAASGAAPGAPGPRSLIALTQAGTWAAAIYDATGAGDANDPAGDAHTDIAGLLLEGTDAL